MKMFRPVFAPILALLTFTGCASVNSLIGDINIVSVDQEKQISAQVAGEVAKTSPRVQDAAVNQRIRNIGNRLVAGLPVKEFDYQFFVVQDATPNAFTIPGGKIYVHSGLIKMSSGDDELAGVIGHEIGHAFKRHPAKGLTRAYGVEYISQLLFKDPTNKFKQMALQYAKGGLLARYGREDEYEADTVGFQLSKQAGYNTSGLVSFLKKIRALEKQGSSPLAFLSTHPPTPERIARLEAMR